MGCRGLTRKRRFQEARKADMRKTNAAEERRLKEAKRKEAEEKLKAALKNKK